MLFQPQGGYHRINNLISEALEDLNRSDIYPLLSRSRRSDGPRYTKKMPPPVKHRRNKDQHLRHKMLSVLLLLTGLIIIISML